MSRWFIHEQLDGREVHPKPGMRGQPCLREFPQWMLRLSRSTWISVTDAGVVRSMTKQLDELDLPLATTKAEVAVDVMAAGLDCEPAQCR
ncbi:MAG TPA: hypothetical protein VFK02_07115 [Kofleriaceae bacterium]|nr:hypothetical protein [Kofleriaceae bacterium]